jgi:cobalt-zinc-cadmium efflux system outer membrane protein
MIRPLRPSTVRNIPSSSPARGSAATVAAALLLAAARTALAAEPITLEALVADTVASNPEVRFYEAEIAAARGDRVTAGKWRNPELGTEFGHKDVRDLGGNHLGDGPVWSVSVAQTFEFPGRLSLRRALADRQIQLAELGLAQFHSALAMRARSAGYQLMAANQRADAAAEVAKRFHDLLAVLVQREPAGVAPMLEMRIIEASALTLSRRASEASIAAEAAQLELNQLRGKPTTSRVEVARTTIALEPAPALDGLLANAREHNYDVRTRVAELQQQGLRVELSRNERWPSVTVGPFVASERGVDKQIIVGLGVTVPLPVLDQNQGHIATATARRSQAEVALTVALREVERKIAAALAGYRTFLAEMARWPPDAVQSFRDAARLGDEHYRLGALPVATYVELQRQYLDAVDALLRTQADALDARQQLEFLTGVDLGDRSRAAGGSSDAGKARATAARETGR